MERRRLLGAGLLGAAILLGLVLHLLAPVPSSFFGLREDVEAQGTIPRREGRMVVWGGMLHSYDATLDRTALFVAFCNHSPCGPVVWLEGDLRGRIPQGPWLLVPRGDVSTEPIGAPDAPASSPFQAEGGSTRAFSTVYDARPVGPTFLGYAAVLALGLAGLAFAAPWLSWRRSSLAALLGLAALLLGSRAREGWVLLVNLASLLLVPVGLATLVGALVALARRNARALAWTLAVTLAIMGLLGGGYLAGHFHPASGAGD